MQGGRGGRSGLFGFGGPFAGFGGPFPGFGSLARPGSLMSGFFGGTNPFGGPFFTNPFGSMMRPGLLGPSMFGPRGPLNGGLNNTGMFGSFMFGPRPQADLNQSTSDSASFTQQAPDLRRPKGPIIKELSDEEDDASGEKGDDKNEGNSRKHPRTSKEPCGEDSDDEAEDNKRPKHEHVGRQFSKTSTSHPQPYNQHFGSELSRASASHVQPQTFMFQSSTVTYGGPNGACYTSSTTRRTGGDGITFEEHKEADTTTGKATHKVSRGIGNKGHSLTRKLNYDGHVNSLQTLHNLNEDELAGFEETWQRNTGGSLPGWDPRTNMFGSGSARHHIRDGNQIPALPAPDQSRHSNSRNSSSRSRSRCT